MNNSPQRRQFPPMRAELASLLATDLPVFDLTTSWLGIGSAQSRIRFISRQSGTVSGIEFVKTLLESNGADLENAVQDGASISSGDCILAARGTAESLHGIWKTALNLLEFCSGVATRTKVLVDIVKTINPHCGIFVTRKLIPGTRPYAVSAAIHGGGLPHRLGLSETILIFDQHKAFFSDQAALLSHIENTKHLVCEKKIMVEVATLAEAQAFIGAGVDGVQFDKVEAKILTTWISALRSSGFMGIIIATGGIHAGNVADYAQTGASGIATSWVYHGPPLDVSAQIAPSEY